MAVHFHTLIIKEIKKETADCVTISFDVPQYLKPSFEFSQGQNITLKTSINGEEVRRSYSICSAPHENKLTVAVKKVRTGKFSSFANEVLQAGMTLEVLSPTGKFHTELKKENKKHYVAFAAGSGITPIISIIKATLVTEPESTFTLVYANRSRSAIIFFEELEALKNKYIRRFNFINILSREKTDADIFYGRINEQKLQSLQKLVPYKSFDAVYICGPEELIFSSSDFLQQQGVEKNKIHFELFTTPGQHAPAKETNKNTGTDQGPKSNISIKLDGRSVAFDLSYKGQSILDAALQQGADLPYACKGGVCCSCRAKLIEGQVRMDVNYALEPEEVEAGFILTCQSHPTTEKVVIDFDVK